MSKKFYAWHHTSRSWRELTPDRWRDLKHATEIGAIKRGRFLVWDRVALVFASQLDDSHMLGILDPDTGRWVYRTSQNTREGFERLRRLADEQGWTIERST